jgi:hypothetical protein
MQVSLEKATQAEKTRQWTMATGNSGRANWTMASGNSDRTTGTGNSDKAN